MNIKNAMDDHYIVRSCVTLYGCEAVAHPQIPLQAPCRGAAPFGSLQTIHPLAREVSSALESFQEQNLWETQIILHHNSSRPIWLPNAKHSLWVPAFPPWRLCCLLLWCAAPSWCGVVVQGKVLERGKLRVESMSSLTLSLLSSLSCLYQVCRDCSPSDCCLCIWADGSISIQNSDYQSTYSELLYRKWPILHHKLEESVRNQIIISHLMHVDGMNAHLCGGVFW